VIDALERLGGGNGQDDRHDVGVGGALERGGGGAGIGGRVGCSPPQLQQRHHGRWGGDIGRNIVDLRQLLGPQEPAHRHPGPGQSDGDGEERRHEPASPVARPGRHDGRQAQGHRGNSCIEAVAEDGDGPLDIQPDIAMQRTRGGYDQRGHTGSKESQARQTMTDRISRSNEHAVSAVTPS